MENHVRAPSYGEVDTGALFQKYTIDEIRGIERKTRQNIERKKEELRQMVGERYRDLIEAADTITDMKNSANNVMQTISRMQELCQGMKHSFQPQTFVKKPAIMDRRKDEKPHYAVAAQIKLLLDTPERIWSALDNEEHLHGTCIFLLARHIHTSLSLDAKQSAAIVNFFPVLTRQWATVSHFKTTILQTCREKLKIGDVADKVVAECLCSILLLEDSTPRQVFNEFLLARTTAIQEQLESESARVKAQICEVMKILATTVHQIYTLFYRDNSSDSQLPCNLLMTTLLGVTEKRDGNSVVATMRETSISKKYLPDNVIEFRPVPRNQAKPIDQGTIQANSQQWIDACIKTVNNGVAKLLGFIDTVKSLASIRDQIWDMLNEDKNMETWDMVCEKTLNRKLSLWEQFLRPMFCDRTKAILEGQMENAIDNSKTQVASVLTELANLQDRSMNCERDLSCYVWSEGAHDLPPNTAWMPLNTRTLLESGALVMKARAFTPAVQSLCRNIDKKFKLLLEDSVHYIGDGEASENAETEGPFPRFSDKNDIQLFLQNTCDKCISKLLKNLELQLYASKQQLANSSDVLGNKTIIDRILLIARFTTGLSELSPHLQKSIVFETEKKQEKLKRPSPFRSQSQSTEDPKWMELKQKLSIFSEEANRVWIDYTCTVLLGQFESSLLDCRAEAVLRNLTKWDAIEIEEETEEGKTVKSTIRVPMQSSWYVQALLYNVCEEINRIGGHALQRSTLTNLAKQLSDGMLAAYPKLLEKKRESESKDVPFTQNRALQMWFDVKFLSSIFPRKDDSEGNRIYEKTLKKVLERAESHIDPFDFDVFSPYMSANLMKHTTRCQVLYGALVSLDRHGMLTGSRAPSSGQQEQHNVLALTSTSNRFPLLPLSGHSRAAMAIVEPPKPKAMSRSFAGVSNVTVSIPTMDEQPKSFLGQMSTMWFSNVKK